jgi:hypothetical protein
MWRSVEEQSMTLDEHAFSLSPDATSVAIALFTRACGDTGL